MTLAAIERLLLVVAAVGWGTWEIMLGEARATVFLFILGVLAGNEGVHALRALRGLGNSRPSSGNTPTASPSPSSPPDSSHG